MKKLFLLAAAFVTGISVFAQKADEFIKVSADAYNFGKIKQNVPTSTYFTITNVSNKPVVIESAWAGCGCTTPEVSKEPIAPGATTKVKVGYNAAALGAFTKDVNIKLAGVQEAKVIKITGEVMEGNAFEEYAKTDEYKKAQKDKMAAEAKEAKENAKTSKKTSSKKAATTKSAVKA